MIRLSSEEIESVTRVKILADTVSYCSNAVEKGMNQPAFSTPLAAGKL